MPTYNVKGKTIISWWKQVDAPDEDTAVERAFEDAEAELEAGELEYEILHEHDECDEVQEVRYGD